jgi:hypothetical protein
MPTEQSSGGFMDPDSFLKLAETAAKVSDPDVAARRWVFQERFDRLTTLLQGVEAPARTAASAGPAMEEPRKQAEAPVPTAASAGPTAQEPRKQLATHLKAELEQWQRDQRDWWQSRKAPQ